jgi:hypothetical protein
MNICNHNHLELLETNVFYHQQNMHPQRKLAALISEARICPQGFLLRSCVKFQVVINFSAAPKTKSTPLISLISLGFNCA